MSQTCPAYERGVFRDAVNTVVIGVDCHMYTLGTEFTNPHGNETGVSGTGYHAKRSTYDLAWPCGRSSFLPYIVQASQAQPG